MTADDMTDDLPPTSVRCSRCCWAQRKSYAEIAAMLSIPERAVHDRAHAALAVLAPRQARGLSAAQREQIGDYLLGQTDAVSVGDRTYLEGSAAARAWAQALQLSFSAVR